MRDRMELEFARYDQTEMICKFSLAHDAEFLYVPMAGREYRIRRNSGRVEWYSQKDGTYIHADYSASMILFDMLAWSKPDCRLAGYFVAPSDLKGTVKAASPEAGIYACQGTRFAGRCGELAHACERLGGTPGRVGDVSYTLPLFEFFPVIIQFWDADEEFDAVLKFMWDANSTDFMHYETIAFAMGHLIARLEEVMEGEKRK